LTAITGEAAIPNAMRLVLLQLSFITSKMAMIGSSVIEYNDKTNVANSAAYLIEIWMLSFTLS
jgi:hypothetical protein